MIRRMVTLAAVVLLASGCSNSDDPVDTTDYSAQFYGKWQVTSGGDELKYAQFEPERKMYLLGQDAFGLRGVVPGAFAADANYITLGGTTFLYARSTDQVSMVNSADTITMVLNPNAPNRTQWVLAATPTDSIPAPVNQGSDIGSDSVHLWMGSALGGSPVLHKIRIATKTSTSVTPPLLITASEWTGGALWCSAAFTNTLSRIDTATGAVLATSRSLGQNIYGLAWDGQYLWAGSQSNSATYVYDPATNSTIQTLAGVYGDGMAFAGGYLYLCKNGAIHKCTPSPFRAVASYSITGYRAYGIAHDGTSLWVTATSAGSSQNTYVIYRVPL